MVKKKIQTDSSCDAPVFFFFFVMLITFIIYGQQDQSFDGISFICCKMQISNPFMIIFYLLRTCSETKCGIYPQCHLYVFAAKNVILYILHIDLIYSN
jgi:hypothetical protein